jgi:hypothetical protein
MNMILKLKIEERFIGKNIRLHFFGYWKINKNLSQFVYTSLSLFTTAYTTFVNFNVMYFSKLSHFKIVLVGAEQQINNFVFFSS